MIGKTLNRNKSIGISCMVFMAYVLFYMTGSNSGIHNYIQILLFALWNVTAYSYAKDGFEERRSPVATGEFTIEFASPKQIKAETPGRMYSDE